MPTRRSTWTPLALAMTMLYACSGNGCNGTLSKLPHPIPRTQTIEGGAQIRLTPAGLAKFETVLAAVVNDLVGEGQCVPAGTWNVKAVEVDYCDEGSSDCSVGCRLSGDVDSVDFTPVGPDKLRIDATFDVDTVFDIVVREKLFDTTLVDCDLNIELEDGRFVADIGVNIDSETGELDVNLADISTLDVTNVELSGCSGVAQFILDGIVWAASKLFAAEFGKFARDWVRPKLNEWLKGFLPHPLGLEGILSVNTVLEAGELDTQDRSDSPLEFSFIPGGTAKFRKDGFTLGVITGINSDLDPTTRAPAVASETAHCVPAFLSPDLSAAPTLLEASPRKSYEIPVRGAFVGSPEPKGVDVLVGISDALMHLVGHHLTGAGAFCLEYGPDQIQNLRVGTLGVFLPSLAELGKRDGSDPLLIALRPTTPVQASIGSGTKEDPSITLGFNDLEFDIYAFVQERYLRALTVSMDVNLGFNIDFGVDSSGAPTLLPIMVGFDSATDVRIKNSEFLREDPATVAAAIPPVLSVIFPQATLNFPEVRLPDFAGFRLADLQARRIQADTGTFLAVGGNLVPSPNANLVSSTYPSARRALQAMQPPPAKPPIGARAGLQARPSNSTQQGLLSADGEPSVSVDVSAEDAEGRLLEWTWRIGGGLWHEFTRGPELVISDPSLKLDGRYQIELRARVAGDYRSLSPNIITLPLTIDTMPPTVLPEESFVDGDTLHVVVTDLTSQADVRVAFGPPSQSQPQTSWDKPELAMSEVQRLAEDGVIAVWARDSSGNESRETITLEELPQTGASSGGCENAGGGGFGWLLLGLLFIARRRVLPVLALLLAMGCSSSEDPCAPCEIDPNDPACVCEIEDELPAGRVGRHLSMTTAPDGTVWMAAYSEEYGDLAVAHWDGQGRVPDGLWRYVDGFPEGTGPLNTSRRNGHRAVGADVGFATSIALGADGFPMVAYRDIDAGTVKLAVMTATGWVHDVVDGGDADTAGLHTSLVIDSQGRPAVAYVVETVDDTIELRYARAQNRQPEKGDWVIETLATAPWRGTALSSGTGWHVDAKLGPGDVPHLAYYHAPSTGLTLAVAADAWSYTQVDGGGSDVGWMPSLAIGQDGVPQMTYMDNDAHVLLYRRLDEKGVETIDDGSRVDGTTEAGLPNRTFHYVGGDSVLLAAHDRPIVVYQDATTHELRAARRGESGTWKHHVIAGHEQEFRGGYGFYNQAALVGDQLWIATWAVDQPAQENWVELFKIPL